MSFLVKVMLTATGFLDGSVVKEPSCNAGDPGSIPGLARSAGKGIGYPLQYSWASLEAQLVKNLPAVLETSVRSLGWKDPLERGKALHYSGLESSMDCIVHGGTVGHDGVIFTFITNETPNLGGLVTVFDSCNPLDCSPPVSSVHGISKVRMPEWAAVPFSRGHLP